MTMMLSRRLLIARLPFVSTRQPSIFPIAVAIAGRGYATAPGPQPKLHPLSPPIPGELDPRFGDLPDWTVPKINRQNLTETPVDPYYDQQNRRYFGEPVTLWQSTFTDFRSLRKMKCYRCSQLTHMIMLLCHLH